MERTRNKNPKGEGGEGGRGDGDSLNRAGLKGDRQKRHDFKSEQVWAS